MIFKCLMFFSGHSTQVDFSPSRSLELCVTVAQCYQYAQEVNLIVDKGIFVCGGFLITLLSYILTIRGIIKILVRYPSDEDTKSHRLLLYPAILFIAILPPILSQILNIFGSTSKLLEYFTVLITHSFGFLNALAYGFLRRLHNVSKTPDEKAIELKAGSDTSLQ